MRLPLIFIALLFLTSAASAHEWYSHRRDPIFNQTTCCGGSDCAPLPPGSIRFTPGGDLRVTLSLEQAMLINPYRLEPFDEVIPFDRIQTSEDGQAHICLMRLKTDDRQGFYCIFLPPNG